MAALEIYRLIYNIAKETFDDEHRRVESYDRKAQIVFAVAGALLVFVLKDASVDTLFVRADWRGWTAIGLYAGSGVFLFIAVACGVSAISVTEYRTYPQPRVIVDALGEQDELTVLASMADFFDRATEVNALANGLKARWLRLSIRFLALAVITLMGFVAFKTVLSWR